MNNSRVNTHSSSRKSSVRTSKIETKNTRVEYGERDSKDSGVSPDIEFASEGDLLVLSILDEAEGLIGTSYRYGGTSPDRGFDCSGLTSYVFASQAIDLPRTSTDQSRYGKRKNFDDAVSGDLVFFGTGSRVNHVGIVVERSRSEMVVIHSTSSGGVRKDEINSSSYWRSRKLWAISVIGE